MCSACGSFEPTQSALPRPQRTEPVSLDPTPRPPLHTVLDGLDLEICRTPADLDLRRLDNLQWRADACGPGSILLFQRHDDGRTDAELVRRYLAGGRFGALIVNQPMDGLDQLAHKAAVFVTGQERWGETLRRLCDAVFPMDWSRLPVAGVTGTNGKTSTIKYLEAILRARGRRVLSIGTLGLFIDGVKTGDTGFTSPPYLELRRLLYRYRNQVDCVVMEVSSHALAQGRVHGLRLAAAGWTNFSQDHLDYHKTEAAYFAAKTRILDMLSPGARLYSTSPRLAERLLALPEPPAALQLLPLPQLPSAALAERPFLTLDYNRANLAIASAMADDLAPVGTEQPPPWQALERVPGRFDCRVCGSRTIVVDFAHTPDALDNVLSAIRNTFPDAHVLTLFGCGGDRDHGKRPAMGAAAARWSDRIIITSDNPRFESPDKIIDDILPGIGTKECQVIVDRREAIAALFGHLAARPNNESWVALIAGKGHEPYIDRNGVKEPYSDAEQVAAQIHRLGWD
jgi:UDP-N-acetylmuramoyl-L-alanyl-D-glutamate--2,6-diaminopimelate ligase